MTDLYSRINKDDAVVLFSRSSNWSYVGLVRDYGVDEFKNNVLALAHTAKFLIYQLF